MPETLSDLELKAKQLRDRIGRLRDERAARRGLPARPMKLLLDSVDELERVRKQIEAMKDEDINDVE
jgi:hypothetical protein